MIQHKALRIGLLLVFAGILAATLPVVARPSALAAQVSSWRLSSVRDWEAGSISDLLVVNNAGGELRLAAEASTGTFVSAPFETAFAVNAAGAVWRAEVIDGTDVRLELRARATPPGENDEGWGP
ncbi:MAG: N-acetylmuramoyl-L-alanine amidase, partial [Chloroflexus aggregans]